jgi:hypothetical protein
MDAGRLVGTVLAQLNTEAGDDERTRTLETNMTTRKPTRFLKMVLHAAALVFGGFWLVATSAAEGPAAECFTGLNNPTTIQVVLGTPVTEDGGTGNGPSCNGLDGLSPGGTVTLTLTQGPRPNVVAGCWNYQTTAIEGPTGVTISTSQTGSLDLTDVYGAFASPTEQACGGSWSLALSTPLVPDKVVSPLDAGPSQPWILHRSIDTQQGQFCDGTFPNAGQGSCEDSFPVVSITEVTP